jgi:hypothetical protein
MSYEKILSVFKVSRDAVATNRGFYYQYLVVLQKWIRNYIGDINDSVLSEVDEDIKEVGNNLIFTQVKSYSSAFSLNSRELRKVLFDFYVLFIENYQQVAALQFVFHTNSSVSKNEKLLRSWIDNPQLSDEELLKKCVSRLRKTLTDECKRKARDLKSKNISSDTKKMVGSATSEMLAEINSDNLTSFVKSIKWEFIDYDPIKAVEEAERSTITLLKDPKLGGRSPFLLINLLLSEIYRVNCFPEKDRRVLTIAILQKLIEKSDLELRSQIDSRFIRLIGTEHYNVAEELEKIRLETQKNTEDIHEIKSHLNTTSQNFPKELTFTPRTHNLIGRSEDILKIKQQLSREDILLLTGEGGLGKTSLVKGYLAAVESDYDHFAWVSGHEFKSEVASGAMVKALGISFSPGIDVSERYEIVCSKIRSLHGKKLLIIDNLRGLDAVASLKDIAQITGNGCKVIVTSRYRIPGLNSITIEPLTKDRCMELVKKHCQKDISEETAISFFELVRFNTLMIELCAKLVNNSLGVTFESIINYLQRNELDANALKIDILSDDFENVQLFSHLANTFNLSDLSENEKHLLKQFAMLPERFSINDFIECYGLQAYEQNKVHVVNIVNSLHAKGWLTREVDSVHFHPFIQRVLKYEGKEVLLHMFFINYLCHRLNEVNGVYSTERNKFMNFAESILLNIAEKDRDSMRQPFLLLEMYQFFTVIVVI